MEANTKRQPESKKWFFLKILCAAFFCFIAAANVVPASAGIWYVDGGVVDSGNGGRWVTAFKTIQEAIDTSSNLDEIWVKAGTYAPASYILINKKVAIYGGFAGTETERDQRDWRNNVTTVDGLGAIDHCFYIDLFMDGVVIDGFTITGGYADGADAGGRTHNSGGGMVIQQAMATIANCIFTGNTATGRIRGGGAIYILYKNSPTIINCAFYDNTAINTAGSGGTHGGAIYIQSSDPTITGCVFQGNTADGVGGALFINGDTPAITNCTFNGNIAQGFQTGGGGGAIYTAYDKPNITNCILWGDSATQGGQEIANSPSVSYCDIEQVGYAGISGNISVDPEFIAANNGDLHIKPSSPCVDAGDDNAVPAGVDYDIDGDKRIVGSDVDMGADEYKAVWYVDQGITASGNGIFWNGAFKTIPEAIAAAEPGHEIWVKEGTYSITASITMDKEVAIYGGFAGTEMTQSRRDWIANNTTVNGQGSAAHCFLMSANAVIDGFTVTGGNANDAEPDNNGGGIYIGAAGATVRNCMAKANNASGAGGGIYNLGTSAVTNCVISGNDAVSGGGVASEDALLTIVNCTLSKNTATSGGGIWTHDTTSAAVVANCIVWGNTATEGAGIHVANVDPAVTYSDVEGGTGKTWFADTDLAEDPFFVDADNDDFHLRGYSPCLDVGDDAAVPADITQDFDGDDRILDGDEDSTPAVDMGADEYKHVPATWYVDGAAFSSGDGASWVAAFQTLEEAIDNPLLRNFDQIWVKEGTYTPPDLGGWSNGDGLTIEKYIKLYGGFPVSLTEPAWTNRNWNLYETIIDADAAAQTNGRMRCLNITGISSFENRGYPFVDGFTLTGGNQYMGGAIYIGYRAPTLSNCVVTGNTSLDYGGGICAFNSLSDNVISNCLIVGNDAPTGGAIAAVGDSAPNLINCTVTGNTTTNDSATGTIFISPSNSDRFAIINTIIWGNTVETDIPAIYFNGDTFPYWANLSYNTIEGATNEAWFNNGAWNNTAGNNGSGNVDTDPLFFDPDGADDNAATWADNDYHPGVSDCINTGNNASVPGDVNDLDGDGNTAEPVPFDLAHEPRLSGTVDMGALEVGDSDGDGIMNVDDNCPFTDNPLQEDGDGDGVGDACDGCPSDPDKTDPGQCGCGVADTDTDSDGTADCNDSDDDGDDLPDIWETDYGLDPLDAAGENGKDGDIDGDGYSNYDEFLSGTEPDEGTSLPLEIIEVIPLEGAGIAPDGTRIPNNTSLAVRIAAPSGIDIDVDTSIVFTIDDGTNQSYERNMGDETVEVTKLDPNEPDTAVTEFWVVYHRSGESGLLGEVYDWENTVEIRVDATDVNNVDMVQQSYAFAIETEAAHDAAESGAPAATTLDEDHTDVQAESDYDAAVAVDSGDLEGCRVFYDSGETVQPTLGPSDELPPLDVSGIDAVGVPMNLQPPTVFTTPVKLIIPCPGASDVSALSVYMYNGVDWVEACDAAGVVQPGGEDWMVDGSRENDNAASPSVIAIRVYHFTGVQAGAAVTGGDDSSSCFVGTVSQSGMAMACALILGVMAAIVIAAVRIKKRA